METWRNQKGGTFIRTDNPSVYSYPMGIGAGDVDNDGDVDLFYSNVGPTLPEALLRGNLTKDDSFNTDYMLFVNDGSMGFADEAQTRGVSELGFGWGVLMADFNNDTRMDLYAAQNYAKFPGVKLLDPYPGRLLQQDAGGRFQAVEEEAQISNRNFGITQVVSDFNQDGWPDLVLGNLTGDTRTFLNEGGAESWLRVRLPKDASGLNARVTVTLEDGRQFTRQAMAAESLCSDSTDVLLFGLGSASGEVTLKIQPAGGRPAVNLDAVAVNTTVTVSANDLGR